MATSTSAPAIAIGLRAPEPDAAWLTRVLIAVNLVAFAATVSAGAGFVTANARTLVAMGANFPPATLGGQPWRLVTAMFLHAGIAHLAVNMVFLFQMRAMERVLGRAGFAAIYVAAGLCGGVATLLFGHAAGASVGASGALFGLAGAYLAFFVARRRTMEASAFAAGLKWVAGFVAINAVFAATTPRVDVSAHCGGFVAGFAAGLWLAYGRRAVRAAIAAAVGVAIAGAAVVALPPPPPERTFAWIGPAGELAGELFTLDRATLARFPDVRHDPAALARDVDAPLRAYRAELVAARDTVPDEHRALIDACIRAVDGKLAWYADAVDPARRYLVDDDEAAKHAAFEDVRHELVALGAAR